MKLFGLLSAFAVFLTASAAPSDLGIQAVPTGGLVPELAGAWTKGEPVRIADQKGKKVTVLYFWAVNQAALEDMPRFAAIADAFKDKPVAFVGVGCDRVDRVSGFFRVRELPMPVLIDDKLFVFGRLLRP